MTTPPKTSKTYLLPAEVAEIFKVDTKTVARWAKEGMLPHTTTLGGHRRFDREAIERIDRENGERS